MASMKTNITMIRNLKNIYRQRIDAKYNKEEAESRKQFNELARNCNKAIIADITEYALAKYPFLKKTLKCDFNHSDAGVDYLNVYLKVEEINDPLVLMAKKNWEHSVRNLSFAHERLEKWEEDAIRTAVVKSDLPEFIL